MKEVKAFVKPHRVQTIVEGLQEAGFESVTLSKGEGTGAHRQAEAFPSLEFHFTDSPVVKLELVCQNEETERAVEVISEQARTDEPADGIIYITEIENAYNIKTGQSLKRKM